MKELQWAVPSRIHEKLLGIAHDKQGVFELESCDSLLPYARKKPFQGLGPEEINQLASLCIPSEKTSLPYLNEGLAHNYDGIYSFENIK